MKKWKMAVFLTVMSVVLQGVSVCATGEEHPATGPDFAMDAFTAPAVVAESAILMDIDTSVILYEKNIHTKRYPASVTKLLTCLVAAENSEPTDMVTFSHEAVFGIERGSNNIGIDEGEQLSMRDCYYAALLESANEVSAGIAEHVGGSAEGFAEMMNAKVKELGGNDSNFVNANGLQNDNHYTSAYDMALIAQAFFRNDMLAEVSGTVFYHINATPTQKDKIDLRNHHRMLPGCQLDKRRPYEYAIGGKTGFTTVARQTLVTFAKKDGHRLVCVVLKDETPNHYLDSIALFNYGFACYEEPSVKAKIDAKAEELNPIQEESVGEAEPEQSTPNAPENGMTYAASQEEMADEANVQNDGKESGTAEKKSRISGLTIIVIAVVLAAIALCGFIFYRSYRQEQERRRRRAEIMARHRARKQEKII